MAAWPREVASEMEGRLALDMTGRSRAQELVCHGVGGKEAEEGSARTLPGSGSCKEGGWGCPLLCLSPELFLQFFCIDFHSFLI